MTKKLLSDKWDNAYLNEALHESLMSLRGQFATNGSDSTSKAHEYFTKTPIYLVDHPTLSNYNTNALIVDTSDTSQKKQMIFIFKDGLVNSLNKHDLPDTSDVAKKIYKYVEKIGMNAMNDNNKNSVTISKDVFIEVLKSAKLDSVIDALDLEKSHSKKPKV